MKALRNKKPNKIFWKAGDPKYFIWRRNTQTDIGSVCFKTNDEYSAREFYEPIKDNEKLDPGFYYQGKLQD
jgi:hypothetical protein